MEKPYRGKESSSWNHINGPVQIEANKNQRFTAVVDIFNFFKSNGPPVEITGEACTLKPIRNKDLKTVRKWFQNREMAHYAFGVEGEKAFLDRLVKKYLKDIFRYSTGVFGIWTETQGLVGLINYTLKDEKEKSATVAIILGDENERSRGLGTKALRLMLYYLCEYLNVSLIKLDTAHFNKRARKCFEKCGFATRAFSSQILPDGKTVHKYLMRLYREDFEKEMDKYFDALPSVSGHPGRRNVK